MPRAGRGGRGGAKGAGGGEVQTAAADVPHSPAMQEGMQVKELLVQLQKAKYGAPDMSLDEACPSVGELPFC